MKLGDGAHVRVAGWLLLAPPCMPGLPRSATPGLGPALPRPLPLPSPSPCWPPGVGFWLPGAVLQQYRLRQLGELRLLPGHTAPQWALHGAARWGRPSRQRRRAGSPFRPSCHRPAVCAASPARHGRAAVLARALGKAQARPAPPPRRLAVGVGGARAARAVPRHRDRCPGRLCCHPGGGLAQDSVPLSDIKYALTALFVPCSDSPSRYTRHFPCCLCTTFLSEPCALHSEQSAYPVLLS